MSPNSWSHRPSNHSVTIHTNTRTHPYAHITSLSSENVQCFESGFQLHPITRIAHTKAGKRKAVRKYSGDAMVTLQNKPGDTALK